MKAPVVPVVANVRAQPVSDPDEIVRSAGRAGHRHGALARMREPTWPRRASRSSTRSAPGKVLTGLLKRIADGASGVAIGTPDDVEAFKAARG